MGLGGMGSLSRVMPVPSHGILSHMFMSPHLN
jgi:hypothetical protein